MNRHNKDLELLVKQGGVRKACLSWTAQDRHASLMPPAVGTMLPHGTKHTEQTHPPPPPHTNTPANTTPNQGKPYKLNLADPPPIPALLHSLKATERGLGPKSLKALRPTGPTERPTECSDRDLAGFTRPCHWINFDGPAGGGVAQSRINNRSEDPGDVCRPLQAGGPWYKPGVQWPVPVVRYYE